MTTTKPKTVLVLRTCKSDMTSRGGFRWPESGVVDCPDWSPEAECGNGLHGWLWGSGDWSLKAVGNDIRWLVVEVEESSIVNLDGKVKFPRGTVVGTYSHWREAMALIRARLERDARDNIESMSSGRYGHASATGRYGHASATGYSGHASATGDYGHASATGNYGHASATGDHGWSSAGYQGRAKAGPNGVISILYWDSPATRHRLAVGYVGENGIKADTWYCVQDGELTAC